LGACRCGEEDIFLPAADGLVIAPWAGVENYLDRAEQLGTKRILVPWTDVTTDLALLRTAASAREVELIVGLDPARPPSEEWNRAREAPASLDAALDRLDVLGDALDGVHLDWPEVGLPDEDLPVFLDATLASIRARTDKPISYAIRRRSLTVQKIIEAGFPAPPPGSTAASLDEAEDALIWADAWAEVLKSRVDRVIVWTGDGGGSVPDDLQLLKSRLGGKELWAIVDLLSNVRGDTSPIPKTRKREDVRGAIDVLRSRQVPAFAGSAEYFLPAELLGPDSAPRPTFPEARDADLENKARDAEHRLRRCCLRDGQVVSVYDHRYERDHGDNMWQEDACWITGLFAAAMAFKSAVTGEREAEVQAREAWLALHQMANTTPLKGEVVRNYSRTLYGAQTDAVPPGSDTIKRWRRAEGSEMYWVGDISVDQLSGWFLGVATYYDFVATDDEKRTISADVAAVLDIFLENDLKMIEFTGQPTTFGNLRAAPAVALAAFQIGFHITRDEKYRTEFLRLLDEEGIHFRVGSTLALYHQAGRFGSDHFYSSSFYPLLSYETDGARRNELEIGLENFHTLKRRHGDAYADTVYAVFHPELDAGRRAVHELANYRSEFLDNSRHFAEIATPHPGPFVPIEQRPAAELDFDYAPPGEKAVRGGLEGRFSGAGYMLSYWMARYHGLTRPVF
jgi:hypothetical protein